MKRLYRAVHAHWFAPAPLRDLALARIVIVSGQLLWFLPDRAHQSWLASIDESFYNPLPALKVLLLPFAEWGARPDPIFLDAVWVTALVTGVLAAIGWFTRPSLLLFAATITLMVAHRYSYQEFHHPEAVMVIALWVLAMGPAGEAFSVDDLKRRVYASARFMQFRPRSRGEEESTFARWPLRTIQWTLVLAYLSAAMSKVAIGGLDWLNGYTLGYYLLHDGLQRDLPAGVFLHDKTALLVLVSVVVLVFELTFAAALLVPALTLGYLLLGAGMHTGIYFLMRAPFFQYIVVYSVFWDQLRRAYATRLARWIPRPATVTVIYDGSCGLCIRAAVVLDYIDVRRRLHFVELEQASQVHGSAVAARHAMQVTGADHQVYRGLSAFRRLARVLPLLWPILPFLYAPGAGSIVPALTARTLAKRCSNGACAQTVYSSDARPLQV